MEYRSELKFRVSDFDLDRIRYRLMPLLEQDKHQKEHGYLVRSLYFDDIYDSYMAENEAGADYRYKYRLRIYNGYSDLIHLEKKIKYRGMTKKVVEELNREECDMLLTGNLEKLHKVMLSERKQLLKEIHYEMLRKKLMPKCIVEYERFALIERKGNVRITFDRNIEGNIHVEKFYDHVIDGIPIMERGCHILEIKYDQLLPQYILQAVDIGSLHRQSFSKYYSTRKTIG